MVILDFDAEEIEAASHWYNGIGDMLYAVTSTGTLATGTIRPRNTEHDRPMTNAEWAAHLVEKLDDSASSAASDCEARIAAIDPDDEESDLDELQADLEGLQSIVEKCEDFATRVEAGLKVDAACEHYSNGDYARYTSLGSYSIVYILADGSEMCAACANQKHGSEASVFHEDKQWRIVGSQVHWEGDPLQCSHCNAEIESSYGPTEDK